LTPHAEKQKGVSCLKIDERTPAKNLANELGSIAEMLPRFARILFVPPIPKT
jgi:hypothetical protein